MTLTPCACGKHAAVTTCTNCGRRLCTWHRATSPVQLEEGEPVVLVPVCLPLCDADYWRDPLAVREWRPAC